HRSRRPGTQKRRPAGLAERQNVLEQVPPLEAAPYRTRAVQQLIKGLAWGPPTSRAVWAALESPITATAAPTSTTSLPATASCPSPSARCPQHYQRTRVRTGRPQFGGRRRAVHTGRRTLLRPTS